VSDIQHPSVAAPALNTTDVSASPFLRVRKQGGIMRRFDKGTNTWPEDCGLFILMDGNGHLAGEPFRVLALDDDAA
jgi:hypothetical protein